MGVTIDEMAERWRRLEAERKARTDARTRAIADRLPAARQLLMERYGARRVVLFGSFARGNTTERSDVDLAVEGLDPAGYFTAIADLTGLLDTPVDLVEIERAPPSLLARLALEGVEL
jgi:predicted nucleotidyltransferase